MGNRLRLEVGPYEISQTQTLSGEFYYSVYRKDDQLTVVTFGSLADAKVFVDIAGDKKWNVYP